MNRLLLSLTPALLSGLISCGVEPVPELQSRPITTEETQRILTDTQFIETSKTLATDNCHLALGDGLVYRHNEDYAAVFSVESGDGGAAAYRTLTYRDLAGDVRVSVERNEDVVSTSKGSPGPADFSCGGWSGWTSNGASECGGSFPSCLREGFVATWTRQSRSRRCCDGGTMCWNEFEYQSVITKCGC